MTDRELGLVLVGVALGLLLGYANGVMSAVLFVYVIARRRAPVSLT